MSVPFFLMANFILMPNKPGIWMQINEGLVMEWNRLQISSQQLVPKQGRPCWWSSEIEAISRMSFSGIQAIRWLRYTGSTNTARFNHGISIVPCLSLDWANIRSIRLPRLKTFQSLEVALVRLYMAPNILYVEAVSCFQGSVNKNWHSFLKIELDFSILSNLYSVNFLPTLILSCTSLSCKCLSYHFSFSMNSNEYI